MSDLIALAGLIALVVLGVVNLAQNRRLHRQSKDIQVNVDGKLDAAIAAAEAAVSELETQKALVADLIEASRPKGTP